MKRHPPWSGFRSRRVHCRELAFQTSVTRLSSTCSTWPELLRSPGPSSASPATGPVPCCSSPMRSNSQTTLPTRATGAQVVARPRRLPGACSLSWSPRSGHGASAVTQRVQCACDRTRVHPGASATFPAGAGSARRGLRSAQSSRAGDWRGGARRPRAAARAARRGWRLMTSRAGLASRRAGRRWDRAGAGTRMIMPSGWPWSSLQRTGQADFWHPTGGRDAVTDQGLT
jgi:hypothetical protein